MKEIDKLIRRFNNLHPDYEAHLDEIESGPRYYRIVITEPVCGMRVHYTFYSCRSFKEWMDGVVLD